MTPSEEHLAFYHEIGMTVTQWASVEQALWWIVSCCFDKQSAATSAVGFYAIENFRSKIQFTGRVFRQTHTKPSDIKRWEAIALRAQSVATDRNKIVHQSVMVFTESSPGRQYALIPTYSRPTKRKSRNGKLLPPPGSLCVRDICKIRYRMFALHVTLHNFYDHLRGEPELFPVHLEAEKPPQTLSELRTQTRVLSMSLHAAPVEKS